MRNILVTGGSRGLGLGIARTLARDGYCVIAVARHISEPLAASMQQAEAGALYFQAAAPNRSAGFSSRVGNLTEG